MDFYTQNGLTRPVRLCEATRKFAFDSLNRKYGLDTLKIDDIKLDSIQGFTELSLLEKYDNAILRIAEEAPIRICDGEKISGAATLGYAIRHYVPVTYDNQLLFFGVSHLTVDFETVLKKGIYHIKAEAEKYYQKYIGTDKEEFSKSALNCISAFEIWHNRYLCALADKPEYKANYYNLLPV